jgi:hypothetical protein
MIAALIVFVVCLAGTLGASELLVRGIDRVSALLRLSGGLIGLLTAVGADAPEISSALVALFRRPLNVHDPLSCRWLVARELKVDDPIPPQPVQERVHVLLRPSITHGCLSALLLHATDAWSQQCTGHQLGHLLFRPPARATC